MINHLSDAAISYAATWYDGIGRTYETANYGVTGTSFNRSTTSPPAVTTLNILATAYEYAYLDTNADGSLETVTKTETSNSDGSAIRTDWTIQDATGRTIRTIQNYNVTTPYGFDGNNKPLATDTACDITVDYQFDGPGRLVTMTAYNAKGTGIPVEEQTTRYVYGSTINAWWQTAVVYPDSTDVLSQDSTTKVWTITTDNGDHVSTTYDRLGRVHTTTDQNNTSLAASQQRGVTHTYTYGANGTSAAGKVTLDAVTIPTASTGVDNSVLLIVTGYDDLGRVQTVTSYPNADGTGTPVNETQESYDGWGNLAQEWQSHSGACGHGHHAQCTIRLRRRGWRDRHRQVFAAQPSHVSQRSKHSLGRV